ncbi:hypothetical protein ACH4TX_33170 [Streptomyces sp. NPDC021098]|uniref:hypothetical protein n=1 Tax=unclassified Streptomyces TaxID=2593676 RepID=UPI00379D53B5
MMTNGKIAVAVAGGYLLGRTKKAKLALGLGMLLAGKKITLDPQQLARAVADSPLLSGLNAQARKELTGAAKTAATRALSSRMDGLADSLHERTLSLRGEAEAEEEPEDDEAAGEAADEDSGRKPPASRRKAPRAKAAKAPAGRARKVASSSPGAAKKTAAKTARKTGQKTAQKTAGGRNG